MSSDQLEQIIGILTRRQPFHSFEIEMTTGDRLLVIHPEAIVREEGFFVLLVIHPEAIVREEGFFVYRGTDSAIHIFTASGVCQVIDLPPAPVS